MAAKQVFLGQEIVRDLWQQKWVLFLLILVVASALSVVFMSHTNRNQVSMLETMREERDQLDIEWRHLILEQNALTEHSHIESVAQEQLNMTRPGVNDEVIVTVE